LSIEYFKKRPIPKIKATMATFKMMFPKRSSSKEMSSKRAKKLSD